MSAVATKRPWRLVEPSALPGFGPALGLTLIYLSFFVLLPLTALALRPWESGLDHFVQVMTSERTIDALKLSFGASFIAACINAMFGTIVAWVLVRYEFPGRKLLDAFVDLPFALPTAVAGIALAAIYAPNGVIGALSIWNPDRLYAARRDDRARLRRIPVHRPLDPAGAGRSRR